MNNKLFAVMLMVFAGNAFASEGCELIYRLNTTEHQNPDSQESLYDIIIRQDQAITFAPTTTVVYPLIIASRKIEGARKVSYGKVARALDEAKKGDGLAISEFARDVSIKSGKNVQKGEVIQALLNANSVQNLCRDGKPLNYNQTVSFIAKTLK